jgi:hypothetical protein
MISGSLGKKLRALKGRDGESCHLWACFAGGTRYERLRLGLMLQGGVWNRLDGHLPLGSQQSDNQGGCLSELRAIDFERRTTPGVICMQTVSVSSIPSHQVQHGA